MFERIFARESAERGSITDDGVERREALSDEYARHEEGVDGAVGGAVVGAAVGAIVAGPVGAVVGGTLGAAAGGAAGAAGQERNHRGADDTGDDSDR